MEEAQVQIAALTDPLSQAWEEANREGKISVANPEKKSYNNRTDVPSWSESQTTQDEIWTEDAESSDGETVGSRSDTDVDIHIRGYLEHIVDDIGNVDALQMGRLRRDIQKGILNGKEIGAISRKMAELGITTEICEGAAQQGITGKVGGRIKSG